MNTSDIQVAVSGSTSTISVSPPGGSFVASGAPSSTITVINGVSLVAAPSGSPVTSSMATNQSAVAVTTASPVTVVESMSVGPAGPPGPSTVPFLSIVKWGR